MRSFLLASLLLLAWPRLYAADSIVVGTLTDNRPMDYVPDECPKDSICLRSWWLTVVKIEKTVHGPSLSGRVRAAATQHTGLNRYFKHSVRLFVLRPITDAAERSKLRVSYYLEAMTLPKPMYCLSKNPSEYGLQIDELFVNGTEDKTYCFELPSG